MAFTFPPISFKKSVISGAIPAPTDLVVGEIAINLFDKKIYTKDHLGSIVSVGSAGSVEDSDILSVITSSSTDYLPEGANNLYYTVSRVDSDILEMVKLLDLTNQSDVDSDISVAILGVPGLVTTLNDLQTSLDSDSDGAGAILTELVKKLDKTADTTDDLTEGLVNFYYTDAKVDARVATKGFVSKAETDSDFAIVQNKIANNKADVDSDLFALSTEVQTTKADIDSDIANIAAISTADLDSDVAAIQAEIASFGSGDASDSDVKVLFDQDSDTNARIDSINVDSDINSYLVSNEYVTQSMVDSDINVAITGTTGVLNTINDIQDALDSDSEVTTVILNSITDLENETQNIYLDLDSERLERKAADSDLRILIANSAGSVVLDSDTSFNIVQNVDSEYVLNQVNSLRNDQDSELQKLRTDYDSDIENLVFNDLKDVSVPTPQHGEVIVWDSDLNRWVGQTNTNEIQAVSGKYEIEEFIAVEHQRVFTLQYTPSGTVSMTRNGVAISFNAFKDSENVVEYIPENNYLSEIDSDDFIQISYVWNENTQTSTIAETLKLDILTSAPAAVDGTIAIADGTLWDPTSSGVQSLVIHLNGSWQSIV